MNKLLFAGLITLLYANNAYANNNIDDDDYFDNSNLRVDFYNTHKECINSKEILYRYVDNLYINCDCNKNSCFDKLNVSKKFKKIHFNYNNTDYYLTNFIYNNTCYNHNKTLWINANFSGYKACLYYIYIIFLVLFIIGISLVWCYKDLKRNKRREINNNPPDYQTINLIN
jgi:hypothetical protein